MYSISKYLCYTRQYFASKNLLPLAIDKHLLGGLPVLLINVNKCSVRSSFPFKKFGLISSQKQGRISTQTALYSSAACETVQCFLGVKVSNCVELSFGVKKPEHCCTSWVLTAAIMHTQFIFTESLDKISCLAVSAGQIIINLTWIYLLVQMYSVHEERGPGTMMTVSSNSFKLVHPLEFQESDTVCLEHK